MKKQRVVPLWVSSILLILCAAAFIWVISDVAAARFDIVRNICFVPDFASVILAVCYCFGGYTKSSAGFFKAVVFLRLISTVIALITIFPAHQWFPFVLTLILFACTAVFAFVKDIGKVRSMAMAVLMILIPIAYIVYTVSAVGFQYLVGAYFTALLQSIIFAIMVYAKYEDKTSRGTK